MSAYTIGIFVHFLGLLILVAGFAIHHAAGALVRRAARVEDVRTALGLAASARPLFPLGALLLLFSGLHLAGMQSAFTAPWVLVGLITVVALMIIGPTVQGKGYRALGKASAAAGEGPVPPELTRAVRDRGPWTTLFATTGALVGLVWLMAVKPAWTGSVLAVLLPAAVGAALGRRAGRRVAVPNTAAADPATPARSTAARP